MLVGSGATGTIFFYDGWNLIAEYKLASNTYTLDRTYTWGLDLSGTLQGAGGVGGLLAVQIHSGADAGTYHPTYDANGNISEYLAATGGIASQYHYTPFGEATADGAKPELFHHRFSTKYLDAETGLYYYGYRSYDPKAGKWLNRDPLGEAGELNLYGYVGNDPINFIDLYGLSKTWPWSKWDWIPGVQIIHAAFDFGAIPSEGVAALLDTLDSGWDTGKARAAECDSIANGGAVPKGAFGDAAATGVPQMASSALEAASKIPGTSLTGPPVNSITSIASGVIDSARLANAARLAYQSNRVADAASRFGGVKSGMTGMGYQWVQNSNTRFGGYFRRPMNSSLPSPKKVNSALNCD